MTASHTRAHNFNRLGPISASHAVIDFYETLIPPLLPFLTVAFTMNFTMAGLVMWTFLTTGALLQPLVGLVLDRIGKGWIVAASLFWAAGFWGFVGYAPTYGWLLVIVALAGIANTVYHPAASMYVRKRYPAGGGAMAIWSTSGNIGVSLAPLLAALLLATYGLQATPWLILPGLMMGLFLLFTDVGRLPLHDRKADRNPTAIPEYRDPARSHAAEADPPKDRGRMGTGPPENLQRPGWALWLLVTAVVLRFWGFLSLMTLLPLMYVVLGHSETAAGLRLSLLLFIAALLILAGGYLSDIGGRRRVMVISLIMAVPLLLAGFTVGEPFATILVTLGGGLFMASHSANIVHAQELLPGREGTAAGLILGLAGWLASVGVLLTSLAADLYGVQIALITTVTVTPLLAAVCVLWVPETRPAPVSLRS